MTSGAVVAGRHMGQRFSARGNVVVTIDTDADDLRMIHRARRHRFPRRRSHRVTGITLVATGDVIGEFATRLHAVMTANTGAANLSVIDRRRCHRFPQRGKFCVTGLAQVATRNVQRGFSAGFNAVMAANAIVDKAAVIHRGAQPSAYHMADVALLHGIDMCGMFTAGDNAIMTTRTGADDLRMIDTIHRHRNPFSRQLVMACLTHIRA